MWYTFFGKNECECGILNKTLSAPPIRKCMCVKPTQRKYRENLHREITTANWSLAATNQPLFVKMAVKYRLGTVRIKILGGLNRFYVSPTSPSASVMAQIIQLFGPYEGFLTHQWIITGNK